MSKKKTSPGMAQLLTEEFWATTREMQERILQEQKILVDRCYFCEHILIRDRRPDGLGLDFFCKKGLTPADACPHFEQNKKQIIIYCDRAIDPKE